MEICTLIKLVRVAHGTNSIQPEVTLEVTLLQKGMVR
jgi:hypothetical protein